MIQTVVWGSDLKENSLTGAVPESIEGVEFETEEIAAVSNSDKRANKIALLKGVYVTSKREDILLKGRPKIKGVEFQDFRYPEDEKSLKKIIHSFLDKPLTAQLIADLRSTLVQYFRSTQHPTARILLP